VVNVFPAARFVPAQPTYVFSARSMRDAQAAFVHLLEMWGMMEGFEVSEAGRELGKILGVDPTDANAVAGIGVDLDASIAIFSEDISPTFVVHLKSPDSMTSFLEGQRQRGLRTQSVISGGTEVFSAKIESDLHIGWAVEGEWLWVHFAIGGAPGVEWFEHSKKPAGAGWVDGWKWAQGLSQNASALAGTMDINAVFAKIASKAQEAAACAKQFAAVKRVGLNVEIEGKFFGAKLAFDLGGDIERLRGTLLQPPPGWANASANAPIAAQWNADLPTATAWAEVCIDDDDMRVAVQELGIRSIRGFLHALDPGENEGVGAVAADLSSARFFAQLLDRIPGRSMAESSKTFGVYKGKHISVPFVGKGDYVLNDQVAIGAMGDGVMMKVGTGSPPTGSPAVAMLDVRPQGLPAHVWQFLFEQMDLEDPKRAVQRLMLWSELHLGAQIVDSALVIDAHGNRR
jgi:hypothetical protein